jgi:hypothetical protein
MFMCWTYGSSAARAAAVAMHSMANARTVRTTAGHDKFTAFLLVNCQSRTAQT